MDRDNESEPDQATLDDFFESVRDAEDQGHNQQQDQPASKDRRAEETEEIIEPPEEELEDYPVDIDHAPPKEIEDIPPLNDIGEEDTPDNLPPSILISVDYSGARKKAVLKLYNPETERVYFWYDNTGHQPYCYTDFPPQVAEKIAKRNKGFVRVETVNLKDLIRDQEREMTKVIAGDPLSIGGARGSIREFLVKRGPMGEEINHAWEANIRYHNCYTYDQNLVPGMTYRIENGELIHVSPKVDKKTLDRFVKTLGEEEGIEDIIETYSPMFFTDAPYIKRIAVDIEVFTPVRNRVPDAKTAPYKVIAIGLSDNEGFNKCFVLKMKGINWGKKKKDFPKELEIVTFDDEREMLIEAFKILDQYPIVLTFVGDAFDLQYLYNRADKLNIDKSKYCPIRLSQNRETAFMKRGVHIDLYRFLKNPSIRIYALSAAYDQIKLETVAQGLLGEGKLELSTDISSLSYYELAHYCWRDANITLRLTMFDNNLLIRLIILFMRISRLSMEDVTRLYISSWLQSLFRQEHRRHHYLIPRQIDIETAKSSEAHTESVIKDKAFKGAIVIEPIAGVHFNTTVLDFASLYPSIMKQHNISYETVDCPHEECRLDPSRRVPETGHWTCKKRRGMISSTIGFFRDTRVKWFKSKSKDKSIDERTRNWYKVVEKALKVFVNAAYGVTGARHFELFCMPAAESVTAYGRNAIIRTKEKAESMGVRVLYGDTDSVFLDNPTNEQQEELVRWSRKVLGIDLEVEKTFKYVALSDRKKNYIGVYYSGAIEVKGLSGKKRNTPKFAQDAFRQMLEVLSKVESEDGFEAAKEEIREIVNTVIDRLEEKAEPYPLEDLAFRVQMTKDIDKYGKVTPQHVTAAKMLRDAGYDVPSGTIIEYIKVKGNPGVLPIQLAKNKNYWIDKDLYIDTLRSVFEQVLDSVGIDFDELLGVTTLDDFF